MIAILGVNIYQRNNKSYIIIIWWSVRRSSDRYLEERWTRNIQLCCSSRCSQRLRLALSRRSYPQRYSLKGKLYLIYFVLIVVISGLRPTLVNCRIFKCQSSSEEPREWRTEGQMAGWTDRRTDGRTKSGDLVPLALNGVRLINASKTVKCDKRRRMFDFDMFKK